MARLVLPALFLDVDHSALTGPSCESGERESKDLGKRQEPDKLVCGRRRSCARKRCLTCAEQLDERLHLGHTHLWKNSSNTLSRFTSNHHKYQNNIKTYPR